MPTSLGLEMPVLVGAEREWNNCLSQTPQTCIGQRGWIQTSSFHQRMFGGMLARKHRSRPTTACRILPASCSGSSSPGAASARWSMLPLAADQSSCHALGTPGKGGPTGRGGGVPRSGCSGCRWASPSGVRKPADRPGAVSSTGFSCSASRRTSYASIKSLRTQSSSLSPCPFWRSLCRIASAVASSAATTTSYMLKSVGANM
mmetsp:Transcript_22027/g.41491  ORF Transcript_22027/g.41491 Transcript_22027/m.41491 type:complete len:203 (-) Transcript_22027:568-1176(-)